MNSRAEHVARASQRDTSDAKCSTSSKRKGTHTSLRHDKNALRDSRGGEEQQGKRGVGNNSTWSTELNSAAFLGASGPAERVVSATNRRR